MRQSILGITIVAVSTLFIVSCDYDSSANTMAEGSEVGGTGKITYSHEQLTTKKHLLTVNVHPGLGETEGSMKQRQRLFSLKFAASICKDNFRFDYDPNAEVSVAGGFAQRSKTYLFECV